MYVLTITVHTVGVPMKATSTWQIAREFPHGDHHAGPAGAPAGPASADNATPAASGAEGVRVPVPAGRGTGGHRRFGWLSGDPAAGRPHNHLLNRAESPYLRGALEMIMAGKSEQTVIRWLVEQRVPTARGGRWTGTTVRTMVTNPAVCGYRVLDGDIPDLLIDDAETVDDAEHARLVAKAESDGVKPTFDA
jgi:hypothetical protein